MLTTTHEKKTPAIDHTAALNTLVLAWAATFCQLFEQGMNLTSSTETLNWEAEVRAQILKLEGSIVEYTLKQLFNNPTIIALARAAIAERKPQLRDAGKKYVQITTLSGKIVKVWTQYYDTRKVKKRRPSNKTRGKGGSGSYPVAELLGIHRRITPALASEVAREVMEGPSMAWARERLGRRGVQLNIKTIRRITTQLAERATEWRSAFVQKLTTINPFSPSDDLTDKVVQICVDGGRVRIRNPKRGRRCKSGRHRYSGDWVEPLLFTITVWDTSGHRIPAQLPFYDGTINDVDQMFDLLEGYLSQLGISKAMRVQFAADGDKKLWPRFKALAIRLGLPSDCLFQIIDYPHAVQHLWQVMDLKPMLSRTEKEQWIAEAKALLFQDKIDTVIDWIELLSRGRNAAKIRKKAEYFIRYREQMAYGTQKRNGLPIGTGVVESAIRRVVNLRLKSVGSFWSRGHFDGFLMLRSYLMAGRWDSLVNCVCRYR